ncbi:MAG: DNA topoisomerase VI subunit B [Methanosarcinales archaeon]|nr:DNA topoisomerase VI subunit B [Methanosarcinales archaeon]
MAAPIAEELAKKQRAISIAEFFEKNRQILGFDSGPRSLLTAVKEAVDNALDACEEASILPDILVSIEDAGGDNVTLIVEDNGPGIVKEQIPKTFAKLLYGSRFYAIKQSRGQQGIGISAAVLYSQLTTGKPARIISKIDRDKPAHFYKLVINTSTNEPEILEEKEVEWDRPRGTRIEMEMKAAYIKGRRQSVVEYLKSTSIVNTHARLTLVEPDGNSIVFDRVTDSLPEPAQEILPHPEGIELGTLIKMLRYTDRQKLAPFLRYSFSKIGLHTAEEICKAAHLDPDSDPHNITLEEAKKLISAFKKVKIMAPPTDCLSPITESLIYKGLEKEYSVDFIATVTRAASVHSGHPFLVEAGIAYGGTLGKEDRVAILRFANRVPLMYQQGGCAITHAVENIRWKNYSINQPGGGLPTGPAVIVVHVASTHIPFTSESKDAVADVPEIMNEIELALKDAARKLKIYLSKQVNLSKRREKEEIIKKLLPRIAEKVSQVVEKPTPDITPIVAKIMGNLLVYRIISKNGDGYLVDILIKNYSSANMTINLHDTHQYPIRDADPEPKVISLGKDTDYIWKLDVRSSSNLTIRYHLPFVSEDEANSLPSLIVEGVDEALVNGARAVRGYVD